MVNEDIVTALKNSVEHGETLQEAIEILISSGYPSNEVYEASKFVGGFVPIQQPIMPEKELIMPEKKNFLTNIFKKSQNKENLSKNFVQNERLYTKENTLSSPNEPFNKPSPSSPQVIQNMQPQTSSLKNITNLGNNYINPQNTLSEQLKKIPLNKPWRLKEIILLITLLLLIVILIMTIFFKEVIINFFS
jgi:hypothetical protein